MEWLCPLGSTTINGLHIGLWILAYTAWRILIRDWRPAGAAGNAHAKAPARRRYSTAPAGERWARRADMLARMHRSADIVTAKRRDKTRRAA